MVSIAPNLFAIEGTVTTKEKDEQLPAFVNVRVQVKTVKQMQGPGELLHSLSKEIVIAVRDTLAGRIKTGTRIRCRIRKAPDRFFLIPESLEAGGT